MTVSKSLAKRQVISSGTVLKADDKALEQMGQALVINIILTNIKVDIVLIEFSHNSGDSEDLTILAPASASKYL